MVKHPAANVNLNRKTFTFVSPVFLPAAQTGFLLDESYLIGDNIG